MKEDRESHFLIFKARRVDCFFPLKMRDVKEDFCTPFLENFMSFCLSSFFLFFFFLAFEKTNNGNLMVYTSLFSLIIIKTSEKN